MSTNETVAAPIMVRARITRAEWERMRVLAIKRGESTTDIIGSLIRDFVDYHDPQPAR